MSEETFYRPATDKEQLDFILTHLVQFRYIERIGCYVVWGPHEENRTATYDLPSQALAVRCGRFMDRGRKDE